MKKALKGLSIVLMAALLMQGVTPGIFAVNGENAAPEAAAGNEIVSPIIGEAEDLREESVKHFLCEDGGYIAVLYAGPVHYEENGQWKDIDASLSLSESVRSAANKATYVPAAGTLPISIPQDFAGGQKITLSSGGYTVGFGASAANEGASLQSAAKLADVDALASNVSRLETEENAPGQAARTQQEIIKENNDKIMELENRSSAIVYEDVFPDTDAEYVVTQTGVKEVLVVKSAQSEYAYRFDMDLGGLAAVAQEDGSIWLAGPGNLDVPVFVIQAPYMYDAAGEYSGAVTMELADGVLTVTADAGWVNDAGRVFPVCIDPDLFELNDSTTVLDTYVSSSWLNVGNNYSSSFNLYAGKVLTGSFCRTYIKFELPNLPASNIVTSARFDLKKWDMNIGSYPILVYDAYKYSWTPGSLKFNNQPLSQNANGCKNVSNLPLLTSTGGLSPNGQLYNIDVSAAVQRWYQNNKSNGLVITSTDENTVGQAAFHSSKSTTLSGAERPVLTVNYKSALPTLAVAASPSGWTNGSVTLTVTATVNSGSALHATPYSFDSGTTWQAGKTKTFDSNQTVNIKVRDAAGYVSANKPFVISNIDKTKPVISSVTGNPTAWTKNDVTLTVNATDNSQSTLAYSFNGGAWQANNTKVFSSNQTVNVRARDAAGNISDTKTVTINRIDKTAPTIWSVNGNSTSWTKDNVILTINASDAINASGLHATAYSFNNGSTWQADNFKTFSGTQTVTVKVRDAAGNISSSKSVTINRIDKTAPTFTVSGNPTAEASYAILTVNASDNGGSGLHATAYSFDNGETWQTGKTKSFKKNQSVKIKVRDTLGNVSAAQTVNITKIKKPYLPPFLGENDGYYKIRHVKSGKYLTIETSGANQYGLTLSSSSAYDGQKWMIKTNNATNQSYKIINGDFTGRYLYADTSLPIKVFNYTDGYKSKTLTTAYNCVVQKVSSASTNVYILASTNYALETNYPADISPHFYGNITKNLGNELGKWELVPIYLKGDVNMDKKITQADASLVLKYCNGTATLNALQIFLADIDNNGIVETADAGWLLEMI